MSTNQARRPAGIPAGGQFASSPHGRPSFELAAGDDNDRPDWGDVSSVQDGSRTPWGTAQGVGHTAPGAVQVSTAGHGGIKLSPERNKAIPPALRNSSGWYEEDCEAGIVAWVHPDACPQAGQSPEQVSESGRQTVIDWFPDGYEAATGETIPLGESFVKDQARWNKAHAEDEVAISAIRSSKFSGFTEVTVRRGGRDGDPSPERVLMVPSDEYNDPAHRHPVGKCAGGFVADPARRYADITPPPAPPKPPRTRCRGIDTSRLTEPQAARATAELARRWKLPDGSTNTLREVVESGAISGKWSAVDGSKRKWYLSMPEEAEGETPAASTYALEVLKSTWDAIEAPDH